MKILKLIYVLYRIRLLSPAALFRLITAICRYGINLMALLHFAARTYGERIAITDERETLTYNQLLTQSEELAAVLRGKYQLASGKKAGVWCQNRAELVKAIYAISSTGADVYLLNAEMSGEQFHKILERNHFDLLIYDEERSDLLEQSCYTKAKLLSGNLRAEKIRQKQKRHRSSSGRLVLLTGGTTGHAKQAMHKPSLFNYLDPFFAFLTRLKILDYRSAYIATPIYHGYGMAVLLLFCALGKKVVLRRGFDAEKACRLIREHQVEVVTVVPLMLHKHAETQCRRFEIPSLYRFRRCGA